MKLSARICAEWVGFIIIVVFISTGMLLASCLYPLIRLTQWLLDHRCSRRATND